jgi:hypothetical protein
MKDKISNIKEDVLVSPVQVQKFGEYRKGSGEYGDLVNATLEWLRTYRKKDNALKVSLKKFLKETNIKLEDLQNFIANKDKTNLISFNIDIQGDQVIFTDLDKTNKQRLVWENMLEVKKIDDKPEYYDEKDRMEHFKERKTKESDLPKGILEKAKLEKVGKLFEMTIWTVDGETIRNESDIDFCVGGNPARYLYVPIDEIWIEKTFTLTDFTATLIHEYIECRNMIDKGLSYSKGHDIANEAEGIFRNKVVKKQVKIKDNKDVLEFAKKEIESHINKEDIEKGEEKEQSVSEKRSSNIIKFSGTGCGCDTEHCLMRYMFPDSDRHKCGDKCFFETPEGKRTLLKYADEHPVEYKNFIRDIHKDGWKKVFH